MSSPAEVVACGPPRIRDAVPADAGPCAAIYAPFVAGSVVSLEESPPDSSEMARRIESVQRTHAWLVLEVDGRVVGYAYGAPFRSRYAFRWTAEVSVYLAPQARGNGSGRALYEALFDVLAARGYRRVVACVVEPNPASTALHRVLGFGLVGTFRDVGYKGGAWQDLTFVERAIGPDDDPPPQHLGP